MRLVHTAASDPVDATLVSAKDNIASNRRGPCGSAAYIVEDAERFESEPAESYAPEQSWPTLPRIGDCHLVSKSGRARDNGTGTQGTLASCSVFRCTMPTAARHDGGIPYRRRSNSTRGQYE